MVIGSGCTDTRLLPLLVRAKGKPIRRANSELFSKSPIRLHNWRECADVPHNKALQLTADPLRGLSAAELGR
jgi:hypothetical protein